MWRREFSDLYYVYMPPKKQSTNKNQATLKRFIEKQENSELGPA
jgi:hypothetical protein